MGGVGIDGKYIPGANTGAVPVTRGQPHEKTAPAFERLGRDHHRAIQELSGAGQADRKAAAAAWAAYAAAAPRVFANVELKDGKETTVEHQLGHKPRHVRESCPRGVDPTVIVASTGRVVAVPSVATTAYDETRYLVLRADGWGVDIVVDVLVIP